MIDKKASNKGLKIIASITIAYVGTLFLLSELLVKVFPDKPTEWYSFIAFIVSPIVAVVIGLVFLKIIGRKP
jgi:hypothetical protein